MRFFLKLAAVVPLVLTVGKKTYTWFGYTTEPQKTRSTWVEFYRDVAFCVSMRSKDSDLQVGCVIVHPESLKILSTGYNGFPPGTENTSKNLEKITKNDLVVHAEANAVLLAGQADLEGSIAFVTMYPCKECAKMLIEKGVSKVYYLSFKDKYQESSALFEAADVGVLPLRRGKEATLQDFENDLIQKVGFVLEHTSPGEPTSVYEALWKSTEKKRNSDLTSPWSRNLEGEILLKKWTDYFLFLALFASTRALKNHQGAILIDSKTLKICALSYNGYPRGVNNDKDDDSMQVSALTNAICLRLSEGPDFIAFSTHFPSHYEAKSLAQAQVKKLYFIWPKTPEGENISEKALQIMKDAKMEVIPMCVPDLQKFKDAIGVTIGGLKNAEERNEVPFRNWPSNSAGYELQPKKP